MENQSTRESASNDPSFPIFQKSLPLQIPEANFYFFLLTSVFGNLKSPTPLSVLTGLGNMRY